MTGRYLAVFAVPLILAAGACEPDPPADEDQVIGPDTAVYPGLDVPGAPGTVTPEVDRPPEPPLRRDTVPEAEPDPNGA